MIVIIPNDVTDSTLVTSTILENDHAVWSALTSYARGDYAISLVTHTVYRSLTGDNLANDPDLEQAALADPLIDNPDPVNWQIIGATNRWRMFDKKPSVVASDADQIEVTIAPGRFIGGLAGFEISAASVNVTVTSVAAGGEVMNRTIMMQDDTPVVDWYGYYFTQITPLTEFVVTDIPPYADAIITVTIDNLGGIAHCGQLVLGEVRQIGITQIGQTGFKGFDFSFIQQDEFGDLTTVKRAATRISPFEVFMDNSRLLGFDRLMRELHGGVAAVWIGDKDNRKAAINYGFYRDYSATYVTPKYSIMSLQIQGIV